MASSATTCLIVSWHHDGHAPPPCASICVSASPTLAQQTARRARVPAHSPCQRCRPDPVAAATSIRGWPTRAAAPGTPVAFGRISGSTHTCRRMEKDLKGSRLRTSKMRGTRTRARAPRGSVHPGVHPRAACTRAATRGRAPALSPGPSRSTARRPRRTRGRRASNREREARSLRPPSSRQQRRRPQSRRVQGRQPARCQPARFLWPHCPPPPIVPLARRAPGCLHHSRRQRSPPGAPLSVGHLSRACHRGGINRAVRAQTCGARVRGGPRA